MNARLQSLVAAAFLTGASALVAQQPGSADPGPGANSPTPALIQPATAVASPAPKQLEHGIRTTADLPAATAAPAAPTTATPAAVTRQSNRAQLAQPAFQSRAGLGQAKAMMVVGFGAVLAGAIIGGTPGEVFMVGGAIIGLYGLYKYLQ